MNLRSAVPGASGSATATPCELRAKVKAVADTTAEPHLCRAFRCINGYPPCAVDNVVNFDAQGPVVAQVVGSVKGVGCGFRGGDRDISAEELRGRSSFREVSTRIRPTANPVFDLDPPAGSGLYLSDDSHHPHITTRTFLHDPA
ncbi:hypothetical protein GCM10010313_17820 [Streptomyces violarus]|nr:hypothetical protein GCM10010313_17820 [Streptomyces violarus]